MLFCNIPPGMSNPQHAGQVCSKTAMDALSIRYHKVKICTLSLDFPTTEIILYDFLFLSHPFLFTTDLLYVFSVFINECSLAWSSHDSKVPGRPEKKGRGVCDTFISDTSSFPSTFYLLCVLFFSVFFPPHSVFVLCSYFIHICVRVSHWFIIC